MDKFWDYDSGGLSMSISLHSLDLGKTVLAFNLVKYNAASLLSFLGCHCCDDIEQCRIRPPITHMGREKRRCKLVDKFRDYSARARKFRECIPFESCRGNARVRSQWSAKAN